MDKFKKYFSCLMLVALSFSCAAHKETAYQQHIPPIGSKAYDSGMYQSQTQVPQAQPSDQREIIMLHALQSLGLPYKWGGHAPETGFDCSGLIFYVHQKAGIPIPRTARAQFKKGHIVAKQNLQGSDLVFFENTKIKKNFHVGIYIGKGVFVHSPGKGHKVSFGNLNNPYFKKYYIGSRNFL
ncbi:C40 family peptidase [Desulfobacula sp.]